MRVKVKFESRGLSKVPTLVIPTVLLIVNYIIKIVAKDRRLLPGARRSVAEPIVHRLRRVTDGHSAGTCFLTNSSCGKVCHQGITLSHSTAQKSTAESARSSKTKPGRRVCGRSSQSHCEVGHLHYHRAVRFVQLAPEPTAHETKQ